MMSTLLWFFKRSGRLVKPERWMVSALMTSILLGTFFRGKDGARTVDEDLVNVCGTEAVRGAC